MRKLGRKPVEFDRGFQELYEQIRNLGPKERPVLLGILEEMPNLKRLGVEEKADLMQAVRKRLKGVPLDPWHE